MNAFKNNLMAKRGGGQMSPQDKTIAVANAMGNPTLQFMQGTSVQIYDSLALNGDNVLYFFKDANKRSFPLTNMNQGNGMFTVGESMVILRAQIYYVTYADLAAEDYEVTAVADLTSNLNWQDGEFSIMQGNQQVLKQMKLITWTDQFNKSSNFANYNIYHFETLLTLQPLIQFQMTVQLPQGETIANTVARLLIEGTGSIFNAQVNY